MSTSRIRVILAVGLILVGIGLVIAIPSEKRTRCEPVAVARGESGDEVYAWHTPIKVLRAAERLIHHRLSQNRVKITGKHLSFLELSAWEYQDGLTGLPQELRSLHGRQVTMCGFMIPTSGRNKVDEFFLVPSLFEAYHGTPPKTHNLVRVMVDGGTSYRRREAIRVVGTFQVSETIEDGECQDVFQIIAHAVSTIE